MEALFKNKVMTSLLILIVGCGYAAYEYIYFQDTTVLGMETQLRTISDETTKIESDVVRVRAFAGNIPAVKQSVREQSLQLEAVLESIPRTFGFNQLLATCNQIALNSGISILKFRPILESEIVKDAFFRKASIELALSGSFIGTMLFLDQMNKIKRLISFKQLEMHAKRSDADEKSKSKSPSLDVSLVIEAYSLGET